jgi:hypothetical protein
MTASKEFLTKEELDTMALGAIIILIIINGRLIMLNRKRRYLDVRIL